MCRILGITNFDYARHQQIVARFCGLARSGVVMAGDPPGHEDGWGLAFYQQGRLVVHKSGRNLLAETDQVMGILSAAQSSPMLILHLRKSAWANTSSTRHAHPFHHDNNVFFHNGVVYDYQGLIADITLPGLAADARDTEVWFYHIMSGRSRDQPPQIRPLRMISSCRLMQGLTAPASTRKYSRPGSITGLTSWDI